MGLTKVQGHGMNALGIFLLRMILGLVRQIPHSSLEKWSKIYLYTKYMLMISFFSSTNTLFCEEFSKIMTNRFDMSMIGELKYFLDFQIKQLEDDTFISQTKYTHDLLRNLAWTRLSPSRLPWAQIDILILT
jgi:hypothetical protein